VTSCRLHRSTVLGQVPLPPMMAPHSSLPPHERLPSETLEALHRALVEFAQQPDDGALREALHALAVEARDRGIPPEEVLVHLKQIWATIPVANPRNGVQEHARTLQRAVTMCIQEYFR